MIYTGGLHSGHQPEQPQSLEADCSDCLRLGACFNDFDVDFVKLIIYLR